MTTPQGEIKDPKGRKENEASTPKRQRTLAQKWRLMALANKLTVIATIVIAVVNGVYVCIASHQLTAMRNQLLQMKKQTIFYSGVYRPWITVESIKGENLTWVPLSNSTQPPSGGPAIRYSTAIKNTGQSIARNGHLSAILIPLTSESIKDHSDEPCSFQKRYPTSKLTYPTGFVIAPNSQLITNADSTWEGADVTKEMIDQGSFAILGCAIYKDGIGNDHRTQFCFEPDPSMPKPLNPVGAVFMHCPFDEYAD